MGTKRKFSRGAEVVLVGEDHAWTRWTGTYVRPISKQERAAGDHDYKHEVAIAYAKGDARLVQFRTSEIRHPWEVKP